MVRLLGYVSRLRDPQIKRQFTRSIQIRYNSVNHHVKKNISQEQENEDVNVAETAEGIDDNKESIPWYLRDDSSSPLVETAKIELPVVPEHAPPTISTFLELISDEYGLEDIHLFDMHAVDPDNEYHADNQPADFIIICTGKSEKHIYKASNELRTYIKHNFNLIPKIEGMISNSKTPAARRRMLRRARKGPLATDNDYGRAANSWVMCDTDVDNICIHILTKERRDELNLESMWCLEEDKEKYMKQEPVVEESDDIFIGIRRLHTMTPFARNLQQRKWYGTSTSSNDLESFYHKLTSEKADLSATDLKEYIEKFESAFQQQSLKDYNTKFNFYKTIHLINSSVISFDKVTSVLLEKYNSLQIMLNNALNASIEKPQDIVSFMKLLIDSPEIKHGFDLSNPKQVNLYSDELCDRLSRFISTLFRFSSDDIMMSAHPEFLPMLWRLSYVQQNSTVIGSKMIDNVIYQNSPLPDLPGQASILQANNRARDILDLINYYNQTVEVDALPTDAFKELLFFTYGNAGNWNKFWDTWEVSFNLLGDKNDTKSAIKLWVRLVVYLAIRNDRSAIFHFFNNYWNHSTSVAGSFVDDFESNDRMFNSDEEKKCFKNSIYKMLDSINNDTSGSPTFSSVREFVDSLE